MGSGKQNWTALQSPVIILLSTFVNKISSIHSDLDSTALSTSQFIPDLCRVQFEAIFTQIHLGLSVDFCTSDFPSSIPLPAVLFILHCKEVMGTSNDCSCPPIIPPNMIVQQKDACPDTSPGLLVLLMGSCVLATSCLSFVTFLHNIWPLWMCSNFDLHAKKQPTLPLLIKSSKLFLSAFQLAASCCTSPLPLQLHLLLTLFLKLFHFFSGFCLFA